MPTRRIIAGSCRAAPGCPLSSRGTSLGDRPASMSVRSSSPCAATIVPWPQPGWRPIVAGTGNEGGVVEDSFEMVRRGEVQHAVNHAVGRSYVTGWFADPATASEHREAGDTTRIFTHEANYHP